MRSLSENGISTKADLQPADSWALELSIAPSVVKYNQLCFIAVLAQCR